jgi:Fe2+ transport system protein B
MNNSTSNQLDRDTYECANSATEKNSNKHFKSSISSIFKKPNQSINDPECVDSAIPLMTNTEILTMPVEKSKNDSKCTRFIRKKFACIIIFLLLFIAVFEFFKTVTEKLSEDHVNNLYNLFSKSLDKFSLFTNNKTIFNILNDTYNE